MGMIDINCDCSYCRARIWVVDLLPPKKRLLEVTYEVLEKDVRILLVHHLVTLATLHPSIVNQHMNLGVPSVDLRPCLGNLLSRRDIRTQGKCLEVWIDLLQLFLDTCQLGNVGGDEHYSLGARFCKSRCDALGPDAAAGTRYNHRLALERVPWFSWVDGRINFCVNLPSELTRGDNPVFWKGC